MPGLCLADPGEGQRDAAATELRVDITRLFRMRYVTVFANTPRTDRNCTAIRLPLLPRVHDTRAVFETKRMRKKTSSCTLTIADRSHGEVMPPLLSEKRIAQLQGAVWAAQHKRMPTRKFVMARKEESRSNR